MRKKKLNAPCDEMTFLNSEQQFTKKRIMFKILIEHWNVDIIHSIKNIWIDRCECKFNLFDWSLPQFISLLNFDWLRTNLILLIVYSPTQQRKQKQYERNGCKNHLHWRNVKNKKSIKRQALAFSILKLCFVILCDKYF